MVHADDMLVPNSSVSNSTSGNIVNYLAKMKTDTVHFASLHIAKYFHFCDRTKSDTFLIMPAMPVTAPKLAVGSGVTAMYANKHNILSRIYKTSHTLVYRKRMRGAGGANAAVVPG